MASCGDAAARSAYRLIVDSAVGISEIGEIEISA